MEKCRRTPPICSIQKNWHAAARCRSDWSKKTGEAIVRKQAKEPQKEEEEKKKKEKEEDKEKKKEEEEKKKKEKEEDKEKKKKKEKEEEEEEKMKKEKKKKKENKTPNKKNAGNSQLQKLYNCHFSVKVYIQGGSQLTLCPLALDLQMFLSP